MELLKQKGNTCIIHALAMVIRKDPDDIIARLGHNGTEMLNGHPFGIHPQELIDVAYSYGWWMLLIEKWPRNTWPPRRTIWEVWPDAHAEARFLYHLSDSIGILCNETHAVAWDGHKIYDPKGSIYELERFNPSHYLKCIQFIGYPAIPLIKAEDLHAHKNSLTAR